MKIDEALNYVFKFSGNVKKGGELANHSLQWFVNKGDEWNNPKDVEVATFLLAHSFESNLPGAPAIRTPNIRQPEAPPPDDGFSAIDTHKETPARVMPKAAVPAHNRSDDEWNGFEDGGGQEMALTVQTHQEVSQTIRPVGVESLPDFDNMQQDIPLNMKKFEFQSVGQELRGLYIGIQKMQKNNKPFDSAVFQRKDGLVWVAGVDITSKLAPIPTGTPVLVRFQGTKNLGNGNRLSLFDVFSLK